MKKNLLYIPLDYSRQASDNSVFGSILDGYFTHRNLIALASGSCVLMKHFPGIEQFFTNWEHCVFFRNNYELLDVIEFLKRTPVQRNKIARSGNEFVRKNYLNSNFANKYHQILKRWNVKSM